MISVTSLSETKRRLLHSYLHGGAARNVARDHLISPTGSRKDVPLSLSQEQLFLRETSRADIPPLYNECIKLRMLGPLDVPALERSLAEIISRHEIWRTSYAVSNGQPVQVVHPAPEETGMSVTDLQCFSRSAQEEQTHDVIHELVAQPFNLFAGPLLRTHLIKLDEFEHWLYLITHLSIVDGLSVYRVFPYELATLYSAFAAGQPSPLPELPIQFGDYARWQRHWWQGEERTRQMEYWRHQLAGQLPTLEWPHDHPVLLSQSFRGTIHPFVLPRAFGTSLKGSSHQEGVTVFTELASGFAVLMHCYTEQHDIIIGTPSQAGRKLSQVAGLLGHFLNPVALRFDLAGDPTFRQVLQQAQRLLLEAISNDDVPFETLSQEFTLDSSKPLFRVAISLQPSMPQLGLDWIVTSMDADSGGAPWNLYLAFIEGPDGMLCRVQYNPEVFDRGGIVEMFRDFYSLVDNLATNPMMRLSEAKALLTKRCYIVPAPPDTESATL
jgi:hypothetical protein